MQEPKHDIFHIIAVIRKQRRTIIISVGIAFVLGVMLAITLPVEYQSSMKILPESGDDSVGGGLLERFGSLAGIGSANFSSGETISPSLYGDVVKSRKFLYTLIHTPIKFNKSKSNTYFEYIEEKGQDILGYLKEYTLGLIGTTKALLFPTESPIESKVEDGIYYLPKGELEIMESLSERITLEIDELNGTIIITGEMPTPSASADLVKQVYNLLIKNIEEYKLAKNNNTIHYLEIQYEKSQKNLDQAQAKASAFFDRNQNILTQSMLYKQKRIEFDYQVASTIHQNISTQLEQVKLEKQKNTPVFSVINPIVIPVEKSRPKRLIILLMFIVLGFVFALAKMYITYFIQQFSREYKKALDDRDI